MASLVLPCRRQYVPPTSPAPPPPPIPLPPSCLRPGDGTRLQVIDFEAMPVGWTREKFVPACDQGGLFKRGAQGGIYGGQNPMPGPNTSASPETYHW